LEIVGSPLKRYPLMEIDYGKEKNGYASKEETQEKK
jgi:hypothetical protein